MRKLTLFLLLFFSCQTSFLHAQATDHIIDRNKLRKSGADIEEKAAADSAPKAPCECRHDTSALKEYRESLKEEYRFYTTRYNYYSRSFNHTEKLFNWQLLSSQIIFTVVILIVISGLVFSGIHFFHHLKNKPGVQVKENIEQKSTKEGDHSSVVASQDVSVNQNIAEMEVSGSGIKLSSSVLGIIILGLSLAFFFLYLQYVFQIKDTNFDSAPLKENGVSTTPDVRAK